jgi:hypothetical protein
MSRLAAEFNQRRQIANAVGRIFDGEVVGVELVFTDSGVATELTTPLGKLTHGEHRNVCFDVKSSSDSIPTRSMTSIGEHLLRRHLRQERFQSGIDSQLWRLIELNWPYAVFGFRRTVRSGDSSEAALRLRFDRYPLAPPMVEAWNADTRSTVEAEQWPQWFIRFVSEAYPHLANIEPEAYSPQLLRISTKVARRLKHRESDGWDVSKDLTQVLIRASCCFRTQTQIHSQIKHRPGRNKTQLIRCRPMLTSVVTR